MWTQPPSGGVSWTQAQGVLGGEPKRAEKSDVVPREELGDWGWALGWGGKGRGRDVAGRLVTPTKWGVSAYYPQPAEGDGSSPSRNLSMSLCVRFGASDKTLSQCIST